MSDSVKAFGIKVNFKPIFKSTPILSIKESLMSNSLLNKNESSKANNKNMNEMTKNDAQATDSPNASNVSEDNTKALPTKSQNDLAEKLAEKSEPEYIEVDTVIAGKVYTINCPIGEEGELKTASNDINTFINTLRQQAPSLSHENLLVLCCLNLFERLQQAEKSNLTQQDVNKQANQLIEKMLTELKNF